MKRILTLIVCAVALNASGQSNSLYFDGDGDFATFEDVELGQQFSISVWAYADSDNTWLQSTDAGAHIFSIGASSTSWASLAFGISTSGQHTEIAGIPTLVVEFGQPQNYQWAANTPFPMEEWVRISLVFDNGNLSVFQNQEEVLAADVGLSQPTSSDAPLYIGSRGEINQYFKGMLSDLRIWNVTLGQDDLPVLASCEPFNVDHGLIRSWSLGEGEGEVLFNAFCGGNGQIQSAEWVPDAPVEGCSSLTCISEDTLVAGFFAPQVFQGKSYLVSEWHGGGIYQGLCYNQASAIAKGLGGRLAKVDSDEIREFLCGIDDVCCTGSAYFISDEQALHNSNENCEILGWPGNQTVDLEGNHQFIVEFESCSVTGCTDDNACNYSPDANVDDSSCSYQFIAEESTVTACDHYNWNETILTEGGTYSAAELDSIEGLIYGGYFEGAHYLISSDVMEWSDGEALAESLGGWLCVVNTEEELDFVMDAMADHFTPASATNGASSGAWVGLYNQEWINGESGIMWPCVHFDGDGVFGMLNLNDELYPGGSGAPCFSDEQESWHDVVSMIEIPSDSICDAVYTLNLTLLSCADVQTFCGVGTIWDPETSQCVIEEPCGWNPDSDDDSLVGVSDLLMFLSVFGSEWPVFNCGDPVLYQGYEYETVQIGEQCWFAENLRSESYTTGDEITSNLSQNDWTGTIDGASCVYGEGESPCENFSPSIEGCNPEESLGFYGRLYNWFAVTDERGLCPTGWHVPNDNQWQVLSAQLGGSVTAGFNMKSTSGWRDGGNGDNSSGFKGYPGGDRYADDGEFYSSGSTGFWWSSTFLNNPQEPGASFYYLEFGNDELKTTGYPPNNGMSVRCIKD